MDIWENNLSCKVVKYLNAEKVAWTSIDVVHISYIQDSFYPIILWIGMRPESLSVEDGDETKVACSCKEVLTQSGIIDVDVEICQSIVTPLRGPKLLVLTLSSNPTVEVRNPLTSALGLSISGKLTPWDKGTGGLFIAEGGDSERLFLITAHHVLFKMGRNENQTFEYTLDSGPRHEVILLSNAAFKNLLESIRKKAEGNAIMISYLEERLANVQNVAGDMAEKKHQAAGNELIQAKEAVGILNQFYKEVWTYWASPDKHILGHVIYSPPIEFDFGMDKHTQDFAVIDVNLSKIDASKFKRNVIDLSTRIPLVELTKMMCGNLQNAFWYLYDRLLRLKGTIPDEEMPHPLDQNGEPCLTVVKHSNTTGLTVSRANSVHFCIRNYKDNTNDYFME